MEINLLLLSFHHTFLCSEQFSSSCIYYDLFLTDNIYKWFIVNAFFAKVINDNIKLKSTQNLSPE